MSKNTELPKTFETRSVEQKWYKSWEESGTFKPVDRGQGPYCIIMPPPNVTGKLHMGHALDVTTQDVLTRFKRMKGFASLWLPGMDHAGIATQSVVEKMLFEKEGKTKRDYSREEFLEKVWKWKEEYGGTIQKQQRALGASCDWDYATFTMDDVANEAVNKFFVDMYNEGLIYQSDYIVNWDPALQSAISDAEVDHVEVKGAFYHLLYEVKGEDIKLEVATTRPETLLGDTAVAVNPEDDRFKHLIGKTAIVPLCNREVPIVGDEHVDIEMGTGCLKVTPGHDFNDFAIGERHNLEIINILNTDGTLNDYGLEFKGLSCSEARKKIVTKLEELNILIETKPHKHQVGHGQRSKAVIEPMVSKQWFLNVQDMSKQALEAVEQDKTRFYPKGWENTYFAWLREPKNWCISRQLLWGHQIPVFYCKDCGHQWATAVAPNECPKCKSKEIYQDPDVLDTWFSSGLWPMTTLGWPDEKRMQEKGFDKFFPSSVLVTGFDIIFFWVARMMMMSLKVKEQVAFHKVYIHAIVRDKQGRKMSKSLGNGIDPLDVVNEYGSDPLRFTLAAGSGYNRTLNLDPERIAGYRNFINKIWNAFRFIHPFLDKALNELPSKEDLHLHERWIISELNQTSKVMNESLEEFRFDDSCSAIYSFVYDKLCSWFIELSKPVLYGDDAKALEQRATTLKFVFREVLKLLHPITPYITEELWTHVKGEDETMLIVSSYPEYNDNLKFEEEGESMNKFIEVVSEIRNMRQSVGISPKEELGLFLLTDDQSFSELVQKESQGLFELSRVKLKKIASKKAGRPQKKCLIGATTFAEIYLPIEGVVDIEAQVSKIKKDIQKSGKELEKLEKKLNNPKFMDKAPDDIKQKVSSEAQELKEKITSLEKNLEALN